MARSPEDIYTKEAAITSTQTITAFVRLLEWAKREMRILLMGLWDEIAYPPVSLQFQHRSRAISDLANDLRNY